MWHMRCPYALLMKVVIRDAVSTMEYCGSLCAVAPVCRQYVAPRRDNSELRTNEPSFGCCDPSRTGTGDTTGAGFSRHRRNVVCLQCATKAIILDARHAHPVGHCLF